MYIQASRRGDFTEIRRYMLRLQIQQSHTHAHASTPARKTLNTKLLKRFTDLQFSRVPTSFGSSYGHKYSSHTHMGHIETCTIEQYLTLEVSNNAHTYSSKVERYSSSHGRMQDTVRVTVTDTVRCTHVHMSPLRTMETITYRYSSDVTYNYTCDYSYRYR